MYLLSTQILYLLDQLCISLEIWSCFLTLHINRREKHLLYYYPHQIHFIGHFGCGNLNVSIIQTFFLPDKFLIER